MIQLLPPTPPDARVRIRRFGMLRFPERRFSLRRACVLHCVVLSGFRPYPPTRALPTRAMRSEALARQWILIARIGTYKRFQRLPQRRIRPADLIEPRLSPYVMSSTSSSNSGRVQLHCSRFSVIQTRCETRSGTNKARRAVWLAVYARVRVGHVTDAARVRREGYGYGISRKLRMSRFCGISVY